MLKLCLFLCVIIVLITLCMITYHNFTPPKAIIIYEIQQKVSQPREIQILCLKAKVTAYNSEVCQTDSDPYIGAWNNPVRPGMIAVSRDLEKLGLTNGVSIIIEGYTHLDTIILDKMGTHKTVDGDKIEIKNTFDIWMENKVDALKWGMQEKDIIVLDPNVIERVISNLGYGVLDMNLKFVE